MLFVFICDIIDSGTYMCVQIGRNSARLYCHQIATDSIENRLEDGNALKLGHGVVEDEAASAADRHSHEDRGPSGVQDLKVDREIFFYQWQMFDNNICGHKLASRSICAK